MTIRKFIPILAALLIPACAQTPSAPPSPPAAQGTFEVRHELKVKMPEGAHAARVWFAIPQDDQAQDIADFKVECPHPHRIERDSEGNKVLYTEARDPAVREFTVLTTFTATRREVRRTPDAAKARGLSAAERQELARHLAPNRHVIIDDRIRTLAHDVVGAESNPVRAARKIYDWELANIDYWVKDPKNRKASPVGSTEHCLTTKTGNCTDFHSLWASMARAKDIPTRIVYGVFLKKELDGQETDSSYHCWPEFYAAGVGWVPHDVAVADIFVDRFPMNADNETLVRRTTADGYSGPDPAKVEYYFGNLDERRLVFSTGRDLTLSPKQDGGPVNALAKAYVEIDGKPAAEKEVWTRKLTYKERK